MLFFLCHTMPVLISLFGNENSDMNQKRLALTLAAAVVSGCGAASAPETTEAQTTVSQLLAQLLDAVLSTWMNFMKSSA